METEKNFRSLKAELKQLASELHADKVTIKFTQRTYGSGSEATYNMQNGLLRKQWLCRHKHIAYSLLKGNIYEQIEPKCREDNKPDQNLIQEILKAYGTQDVRACA